MYIKKINPCFSLKEDVKTFKLFKLVTKNFKSYN